MDHINISNVGNVQYGAISASGQYATIVTNTNGAFISSNYGVTWTQITAVIGTLNMRGISISASGQYQVAAVFQSGVYYSTNYGASWVQGISSGIQWYESAISANGQYLLACAYGGGVYQSITRSPSIYASNTLINFPSSSYTVGTSGFTTLPGNMIAQWGFYTISNSTSVGPYTVTFPKVFPSACFNVIVTMQDVGVTTAYSQYIPMAYTYTTSSYTLYIKSLQYSPSLLSNSSTVYWQAYGN